MDAINMLIKVTSAEQTGNVPLKEAGLVVCVHLVFQPNVCLRNDIGIHTCCWFEA
jgi:hypothetical protein